MKGKTLFEQPLSSLEVALLTGDQPELAQRLTEGVQRRRKWQATAREAVAARAVPGQRLLQERRRALVVALGAGLAGCIQQYIGGGLGLAERPA